MSKVRQPPAGPGDGEPGHWLFGNRPVGIAWNAVSGMSGRGMPGRELTGQELAGQ